MNLSDGVQRLALRSKPRSRGDEPVPRAVMSDAENKTPLTRG